MLWSVLPSPDTGAGIPAFHLIKHLGQRHEISLLAFQEERKESGQREDVNPFCHSIEALPFQAPKSLLRRSLFATKNTLSPQNLISRNPSFLDPYYSPRVNKRVRTLLASRKFDLIYTNMRMAHYVQEAMLPKVVHDLDCMTEMYRQWYASAPNPAMKLLKGMQYLIIRRYEKKMLRKFDACIIVSPYDGSLLKSLCPGINMAVIPNGVDAEFFKPLKDREEPLSLLFVGNMKHLPNIEAVLYFCDRIYQEVKKNFPGIRLYIVGRNPTTQVQRLASDESITVTGYVDDVRPYLARTTVFIAPFVSGTGIKNKILEALAMEKPVVSTPIGARGIDITPDENVILAEGPEAFAMRVMDLLRNETLRQKVACNGRKLVETRYSWQSAADRLNEIFEACNPQ